MPTSKNLSLILLLFLGLNVYSQNVTINGYISDKLSGERLIGANVYNESSLKGTTTNNYGFYSLTVPNGDIKLSCSYIGYEKQQIEVALYGDKTINFELKPVSDEIDEITIKGNNYNKVEQLQMSLITLPVQKIDKIPVIMGESDIMKVVQLMPGIQSGAEGTSGIHVRGGGSDQNLFLIDGVPIYNANHLFGFFSTFNPSAIKSTNVYTGGFPARYGGRLSSVVDIRMNEGNLKKLTGDFTIGLISSKITLEGPIVKDKTAFMFSARRTYADLLAKPVLAFMNKNNSTQTSFTAYFYDINAKISHLFSDRSRLYWSLYNGRDKFTMRQTYDNETATKKATLINEDEIGIGWSNLVS